MSRQRLHFTLGPVQDFVAQSRRTRDLLASSFLLSYLSGHAMAKVEETGGNILFPVVKGDPLLKAITEKNGEGPWVGTLPNRFQAMIPSEISPNCYVKAVKDAWKQVAQAVWEQIVKGVAPQGNGTEEIWNRQVDGFWEITWVVGEQDDLLDRRKNWRSQIRPKEPGEKCTLIGNLQELSGYFRHEEQLEFWETLRKNLWDSQHKDYFVQQIRENERLSAIGIIKRFFPLISEEAIGWPLPEKAKGFPSTSYLAALPWVLRAVEEEPELAQAFLTEATSCDIPPTENGTHFSSVQRLIQEHPDLAGITYLNGPSFFESNLTSSNYWKSIHSKVNDPVDEKQKETLQKAHRNLTKSIGAPSSYYALLLMDGDQLGQLLQSKKETENRGEQVSRSLAQFTTGLSELVAAHDGVTVYAGGDDVLAMLPFHQALPVSVKLRRKYREAFVKEPKATISGALVYAHRTAPLTGLLRYAHHLLDDVAKEACGRDSLAVSVWKTGGPILTWSAKWETVIGEGRSGEDGSTVLGQWIGPRSEKDPTLFSSGFLFKLREQFAKMADFPVDDMEKEEILKTFLRAEYQRNLEQKKKVSMDEVKLRVDPLIDFCMKSRDGNGDANSAEAAIFLRFLRQLEGRQP
ncbi:type III-B CRISPR-associated protein Cas10/Cmr2 [Kroppenstedtia sanguinis]|uniref:Type III-B CRISPR-associated protein Cas10/Cmr2 n=1 Tax=Kroppenstedtia sanguinis TaxID=1380684 RepID=A0ABW4C814_9BACL